MSDRDALQALERIRAELAAGSARLGSIEQAVARLHAMLEGAARAQQRAIDAATLAALFEWQARDGVAGGAVTADVRKACDALTQRLAHAVLAEDDPGSRPQVNRKESP